MFANIIDSEWVSRLCKLQNKGDGTGPADPVLAEPLFLGCSKYFSAKQK